MNTLVNKETIKKLESQMTFEQMSVDKVSQRVYSSFDGRIVATTQDKSVRLLAISYRNTEVFDSIKIAAKWLLHEHYEYHKHRLHAFENVGCVH